MKEAVTDVPSKRIFKRGATKIVPARESTIFTIIVTVFLIVSE
jgi:hypothetical protein